MNNQDYDILAAMLKYQKNQRKIAKKSGYSIGKVNGSIKELIKNGYITANHSLTPKGKKKLEDNRPKNAIILAAGYGMRMVPINMEVPKGLLKIKGQPLIERIIEQLHDVGITDISIVVGFMKEQYEYLIDRYAVTLVYNSDYALKNNLYSLKCVSGQIHNTYVIPCDIWCKYNPFSRVELYSWYMVTDRLDEESSVRVNRKRELVVRKHNETGNAMIGIAYILKSEARQIQEKLSQYCNDKRYNHSFWEECLFENGKTILYPQMQSAEYVFEINTYEQLRDLDQDSDQLQAEAIKTIQNVLECSIEDIKEIRSLKKGMTNRSFIFTCHGEQYIMRIPGEGSNLLIDRQKEATVYRCLQKLDITDPTIYISSKTGYKITKYISGAHCCDSSDPQEVKRCMQYLRKFHDLNIKVDHTFQLFSQIEYYEQLWGEAQSVYRDYDSVKAHMYELKAYIDKQPKHISLSHIDANPDNFLITDKRIYLIDWEYAGMQDTDIDIAMFAIYALYDRREIDQLIISYFGKKIDHARRIKIYCYIALCGFLWSNWCEYKRLYGVEFGEYSLRQYRYAKEYYKIVQQELGEITNDTCR